MPQPAMHEPEAESFVAPRAPAPGTPSPEALARLQAAVSKQPRADMRKANKLIPGIGHRIKSRNNPDLRVELVKEYVLNNFPSHKLLDYALAVETVTTSKKDNLILNVDGCIAVCFVDLVRNCGAFSAEEAEDYLKMGVLNGLFVLGRSIGLIAHFLDQKRLRTGLYRHPWDDITYLLPNLREAGGAPGAEGRVEVSL